MSVVFNFQPKQLAHTCLRAFSAPRLCHGFVRAKLKTTDMKSVVSKCNYQISNNN